MNLRDISIIADIIKICYICFFVYYTNFKIINIKYNITVKKILIISILMILISIVCELAKDILGYSYHVIFMALLISIMFSKNTKSSFAYALLVTMISMSINYIIFIIAMFVSFAIKIIFGVEAIYVGLILILVVYAELVHLLFLNKRLKKGIIFLQKNIKNEYIDILTLNISVIILFCITILSNYDKLISRRSGVSLIIFSIIMFITIQKSLQLYYKQKLQQKELEETKQELEKAKKEI